MPPAPSGDTTSYGPTRVPDVRTMYGERPRELYAPETTPLLLPRRIVCRIDVGGPRRPGSSDLDRDAFAARHGEMIRVRWFRIDAARREHLQRLFIERRSVAEVPRARDDGRDAIIGMRVRVDLRVRSDAKEHGVEAGLRRIALQNHGLRSGDA